MTRTRLSPALLVLLLAAGLLPATLRVHAQVVVSDTGTPAAARTLLGWFSKHIPARFQGRDRFVVTPLNNRDMDNYLASQNTDEGDSSNSHADDAGIDGIFEDDPPRITLRLPAGTAPDVATFAHEYGHYVWFRRLSEGDRKVYESLYKRQKAARTLITPYAGTNVEEGFAEAFSAYVNTPPALQKRDPLSFDFLRAWHAAP